MMVAIAKNALSVSLPRAAIPEHLRRPTQVGRLIHFACVDWICIGSLWVLMAPSPIWAYPVAWLLLAGRFHALGVVLHDACHMHAPRNSVAVQALEVLAGYPITTTLSAMRYHHLRHHRFSGMPLDPYLKVGISTHRVQRNLRRAVGLLLVPAWILRAFYGTIALIVPGLRNSYGRVFLQDRSNRDLTRNPQVLDCLRAEPRQALFFICVAIGTWYFPSRVMFFYFVPLLIAGALNVNRVIVEHEHVRCNDRRRETVLASTNTHDFGVLGRLFLFPRNIGFHQAHHLYPGVTLECLPALDHYLRNN